MQFSIRKSFFFFLTNVYGCCSDNESHFILDTSENDVVEEQLFRSVEGQAASDEEEDKWTRDQQKQVDEVKKILSRLSCCSDR